jgi:hypothetical protein
MLQIIRILREWLFVDGLSTRLMRYADGIKYTEVSSTFEDKSKTWVGVPSMPHFSCYRSRAIDQAALGKRLYLDLCLNHQWIEQVRLLYFTLNFRVIMLYQVHIIVVESGAYVVRLSRAGASFI